MSSPGSSPLRTAALEIVRCLQQAGFRAGWVGGCVRDALLGRQPGDYDIATDARTNEIERLFPHTIPVGRQFGVVVVVWEGMSFQVATFRAESDYADGRHPSGVTFGDPIADARRRDFTINGLFYDPVNDVLHDWVEGRADLKARVIRTIGPPQERFAEDHLRLLRAVRLATQLGFEIEPATLAAIQGLAERIQLISAERIRDELIKLFQPGAAERGLQLLHSTGLLPHVLPELAATVACEQSPDFHPEGTVFAHLCLMLRQLPADSDPLLPWAVLLHDVAKPRTVSRDPETGAIHFYDHERLGADMTRTILGRLRFPNQQIETVATTVRHHMQFMGAPLMRKSTLRRMLLRPTFPLELALHRLDCLGSNGRLDTYEFMRAQAEELARQPEIVPPLLTGHDLVELGLKPGPAMGRLLAEIREKQLADELKTPAEARDWVRHHGPAP